MSDWFGYHVSKTLTLPPEIRLQNILKTVDRLFLDYISLR